jgi:serine protease
LPSNAVQVLSGSYTAGVLGMMDTVSNFSVPFKIYVKPTATLNQTVTCRITMTDGTWSDFYAFKITVNSDYINIMMNDLSGSFTSKGLIGYNDTMQTGGGIGVSYKGSGTILYEMGLMVGASGTQVSDRVRGDGSSYDKDWSSVQRISATIPGAISDEDAYGQFSDASSAAPLTVLVTQKEHVWVAAPDNNYIMVEYIIKNTGTATLNGLYAGVFADWDIPAYADNKVATDQSRKLGYAFSTDSAGIYAGVKLLSSNAGFHNYGIDNTVTGYGGAVLYDGYSNAEKYTTLSNDRFTAGDSTSVGNDVIDVVSTGPFTLSPGDSVRVAFAIIAGDTLSTLQAGADAAQVKWDNLPTGLPFTAAPANYEISPAYPNPAASQVSLSFRLPEAGLTEIAIYNLQGELVKTVLSEKLSPGKYSLTSDISAMPAGAYMYRFTSGDFTKTIPFTVTR